jgi:LPXTG-motif cell wall-anchored protein
MNVWMKRGLQTALLTGGLLAVGSGIASADDSIDVAVPVTVTDNALAVLGTSPGMAAPEIALPAVDGLVRVDLGAATVSVPVAVGGNSADVAGLDVAQPAAAPVPAGGDGSAVDADVPATVTGNAVAVLGEATASGSAGSPSGTGGGASVADVGAPVTACGNGIGALGDATATCTAAGEHGGPTAPATPMDPTDPTDPATPVTPPLAAGRPAPTTGSDLPVDAFVTTATFTTVSPGDTAAGTTSGSTATDGSGQLASTGTDLALPVVGGLLALLLGLALSVRARRRDVPLT